MELQGSLPSYRLQNSTGYYGNGYATDMMGKVKTWPSLVCGMAFNETHSQAGKDDYELAAGQRSFREEFCDSRIDK